MNMKKNLWLLLITLSFFGFNAFGQTIEVKGKVTGSDGLGLPGVSIVVQGTTNGTITNLDGNYQLKAESEDVLVFSFIGFANQEVAVKGQNQIDIVMQEDILGLDEVLVVGYGSQRRATLTGAVSKVEGEQLTEISAANTTELLGGRVAGVMTKQTSGVPGADGTTLSIRGFGNPLVLVDGIETSLARIDPNDIESINVLKDAAAAVYGARAGNGVILVTTKRGKSGKPVINFRSSASFQQPTRWRNNVNAAQFLEMENEAAGYTLYTEEELDKWRNGEPGYESSNWERAIFRTWSPMQQHNLSVRGGSEKVKYFSSIGFLDQQGAFKSGDLSYQKVNVRSNFDAEITERLSFGLDLSFRKEIKSEPNSGLGAIYAQLAVAEPTYPTHIPGHPELAARSGSAYENRAALGSTYRELAGYEDRFTNFFSGNIELRYQVPGVKGLTAKGSLAYTNNNVRQKRLEKPMEVYEWDAVNEEVRLSGIRGVNQLNELMTTGDYLMPRLTLDYDREFGSHSLKGLLVVEAISEEKHELKGSRLNLISLDIPYLLAGSDEGKDNDGSANEKGRSSVIGRINYGFKGKYLFESTFRYDGSHKFAEDQRWGFFPSVLAAWRLSEENFIKNNASYIDNLKIRLSYSQTGYDNIGDWRYLSGYELTDGYLFTPSGLTSSIETTGIANPYATWYDLTNYNIGLDAAFLNGLIGFELDLFYRLKEGIFAKPVDKYPDTFGAELPELNQNATDDRGIDLIITHRNKVGDFKYDIGINFGYAREKWVTKPSDPGVTLSEEELNNPATVAKYNQLYVYEGQWTNRTIGYVSDGIFMSQEEIDNHRVDHSLLAGGTYNDKVKPGDIRYKDLNGDGVIDWKDKDIIGKGGFPEMTFGLNINASYKNFSLSALFQGASGFNFDIDGTARGAFNQLEVPFEYQYKYRWTPSPDDPGVNINPDAKLPAATQGSINPNNKVSSDFWLQDGTYIRLKSLAIGYDIPKSLLKKVGIGSMKIYASGTNLFSINNLGIYKKTFDPEGPSNQTGHDYPLVRTVTFGVNVSL